MIDSKIGSIDSLIRSEMADNVIMVHGYDMVYMYLVSTVYCPIDDLSIHVRIDLLKKRLESKGSTEVDSSYPSALFLMITHLPLNA
jgi:hypothetical protein